MAAGITGCALGEMSDGMIEVLVEGRDAATRDIERLREGKRYYGGKREGGEWNEWSGWTAGWRGFGDKKV